MRRGRNLTRIGLRNLITHICMWGVSWFGKKVFTSFIDEWNFFVLVDNDNFFS